MNVHPVTRRKRAQIGSLVVDARDFVPRFMSRWREAAGGKA